MGGEPSLLKEQHRNTTITKEVKDVIYLGGLVKR